MLRRILRRGRARGTVCGCRRALILTWLLAAGATAAETRTSVATPYTMPEPAEIAARVRAAGDAARWNADVVVVLDTTDVAVRPSGIGTAVRHSVVKILRDAGVRTQAVQRFPFDPHTNRLDLLAIRVYRADGTVEEVPVDSAVEQPQPEWGVFWGTRQYLLSVPRLTVGDAVETRSAMTGFNVAYLAGARTLAEARTLARAGTRAAAGARTDSARGRPAEPAAAGPADGERNARGEVLEPPVPGHWHDEVHFWSSVPVIEKRYTVRVPRDKPLQCEVYNGELRSSVLFDGDELVYSFEKRNLAPFVEEPAMEPVPNVATKLLLATLPSWEDKSRWLYAVSEPHLTADDAIRAKVAEITRGLTTDEEKWTALNHWVAENIRYAGTSRGMCEGYTIHDIRETFRDRAGVCKDLAGMLAGMLRVAGFEAYVVMTMARQRVDRVPADQFNHAVTCIRRPDGTLVLLDPTWMPKSRDNWSTFEPGQHVVYGLPEGRGLSTAPEFPPEANLARWTLESTLDPRGDLTTAVHFTGTGAPETRIRRAVAARPPDDLPRLVEETLPRLSPAAVLRAVTLGDPVDFTAAWQGRFEVAAPTYALAAGPQRFFRLPGLQMPLAERVVSDLLDKTGPAERKYGLKLWATRLAHITEDLTLPPGWRVHDPPPDVHLDGPSAGLRFTLTHQPGRVRYECVLTIKRWIVPPDEYANFKEVMEKLAELSARPLTCVVEDDHAN